MANLDKFFNDLAYRMGKPRWDSGAVPPEVVALTASDHARTWYWLIRQALWRNQR